MSEPKDDRKALRIIKGEAVTVAGSVLATLIATMLISQSSNVKAVLTTRVEMSVSTILLALATVVFTGIALSAFILKSLRQSHAAKLSSEQQSLRSAFDSEAARLDREYKGEIDELKSTIDQLERLYAVDSLTGALNRNQVDRVVEERISEASSSDQTFCAILVDIDGFKEVNDKFNHEIGNRVLHQVAEKLRPRGKDDVLIRYGGDEFLIVSRLGTDVHAGFGFANRLRKEIAEESFYAAANEHLRLTISCGVTAFLKGDDKDRLLHRTADALHKAKEPRPKNGGSEEKNYVYVMERD